MVTELEYAEKIERGNRYSFNISYQGTEENTDTHNRFKRLCDRYDGVYISGLRVLLDTFDQRQDFESLLEQFDEFEKRLADLEAEVAELKSVRKSGGLKTFGQEK